VNTAQRSRTEAAELLLSMIHGPLSNVLLPSHTDWPDELALDIFQDCSLLLSQWAQEHRLAPWTVSRGFAQVFGITPETFRARIRARQAWRLIHTTNEPLAQIAFRLGFADQSHMTRSVKQVTGIEPRRWRGAANRFKTASASRV
jgi:AraC-like DNA-binding protein